MRKLFLTLGIIFTAFAIVFSIMPMDTIAFMPIGLALIFSLLLLKNATENQKKLPTFLLFLLVISSVFVLGKTIFIKDKIEQDLQFEKEKIETKKEAKKELEDLEKDLE